jgi:hypothetical protein
MAFTNCCGVSALRFPPSPPASGPPELDDPPLEEPLLPEFEEPPLEELLLPELEGPPLEELLLPGPVELDAPDELPTSVVCASPPVEPHAVAPTKAEISPHHRIYRMFTSRAVRRSFAESQTHGVCPARLPRALRNRRTQS